MNEYRLAIVGSRDISAAEYPRFCRWIDTRINHIKVSLPDAKIIIVSGGAKGVDTMAETYAKEKNLETNILRPDWDKLGKAAAFKRNKEIVDACDGLFAYWDGKSMGTKNTLDHAKKANKDYLVVYFQGEET